MIDFFSWKLCANYARAEEAAIIEQEISTNDVKSFVLHWDNRIMFPQDQCTEATKSLRVHSELNRAWQCISVIQVILTLHYLKSKKMWVHYSG